MAMPIAVPRYTTRDLESFPNDGNRYELVEGILLVTPAPIPLHDLVVSRLLDALYRYLRPASLATVFPRGVVELEPELHLEPDVLVVPAGQVAGVTLDTRWGEIGGWWLAVEVSGRGSRIYDREVKRPAYLALGVREFWRVDLKDRCICISRPGEPDERPVTDRLRWHPPEMSTALELDVPALFAGVRGDPE
jgi:Uma2 family endonuclease